ncbi:UvrB/UvrC motif-containing protein, partial [Candidatus Latescibacterota bacterium]
TSRLLKQIHGTAVHTGSAPKDVSRKVDVRNQLKELKTQIRHCVEVEDYEHAAELRDRIEEIEKGKKPHDL